ncbi:MAG: hypothetical protein V1797_03575 [Pseudomonadota bacterium]
MRPLPARHNPAPRPRPGGGAGLALMAGLLWLLLLPAPAQGHGIELSAGRGEAAWARGEYSGGEPMSFVKARVLGPDGQTHQVGNTDAQGRFAWLPDRDGPWRVVLDDGQGHRGEAALEWRADVVAAPTAAAPPAEGLNGQPLWVRAVWGVSLFFWLSGLAFWRLGRRRRS